MDILPVGWYGVEWGEVAMQPKNRVRSKWGEIYEKTDNAGMTCLRCWICRPMMRK